MEQLKLAWIYRFWIVMGVVLLMPIVGYFANTSSLAKDAKNKKTERANKVAKWEKLAKGIITDKGLSPNETWAQKTEELKKELNEQVNEAWIKLYQEQVQFTSWPEDPESRYDIPVIFENARAKPENVPVQVCVVYRELFRPELERVFATVEPVGFRGSKELVEIEKNLMFKFLPPWADPDTDPPTVAEAWLAQEDIWILRAVLDVVRAANEGSTKLQESAIKQILDIKIGAGTAGAIDESFTKSSKETLLPPSFGAASSAGSGGGVGQPASSQTTASRQPGRYIGTADNKLFKQMPIFLQLIVDQRKIVDVLAKFTGSHIPMQVTKVELYQASAGPAGQVGGSLTTERAPAKEDESFHRTELRVWVRASLYEKPESLKTAEIARPQGAPASPTQAGASK